MIMTAMPLFSQESAGLFFLGRRGDAPGAVALRGARDAVKDLAGETGRKIEVVSVLYTEDKGLSSLLEKAYISGAKGAIISLGAKVDGQSDLDAKIKSLGKKGFTVAVIGEGARDIHSPIKVLNDDEKLISILDTLLKPHSGAMGFQVRAFASAGDNGGYEFSEDISRKIADKFCGGEITETDFFSAYQKTNKTELERLDNYALIFLSPKILADAGGLEPDKDRLLSVVLGARASVAQLFATGQLDACITPDYYGFGYASMRRLIEDIFLSRRAEGSLVLPPKVYEKTNLKKFLDDWASYLN